MIKDIDLTAAGYPSIDRIIKVMSTPCVGKTSVIMNGDSNIPFFGGCNVNVAYTASAMGLKCALAMRVGMDFDSSGFKAFLEQRNINLEAVERIEEDHTSCSYLVMDRNGEHITLFYPGAMDVKYSGAVNEDVVMRSRYGMITVGNPAYNLEFARVCKRHKVPMVFGMKCDFKAFTDQVLEEIIQGCEILVMNEGEKAALERVLRLQDITQTFDNGVTRIIIVTKGREGSCIMQYNNGNIQTCHIPIARSRKTVDTTGVGDAYLAGFMSGYLRGKPVEKCGRMGSVLSSFVVEEMGCLSNIPTMEEACARYEENYGEEF